MREESLFFLPEVAANCDVNTGEGGVRKVRIVYALVGTLRL